MKKIVGCLVAVVFLAISVSLVFAGTAYFPLWEIHSSGYADTGFFISSLTDNNTVTITVYEDDDNTNTRTTSRVLNQNEQWTTFGLANNWMTGDGFSAATGGYYNGSFHFGCGKIEGSEDGETMAFVDVVITSNTVVSGFSVPLGETTAGLGTSIAAGDNIF